MNLNEQKISGVNQICLNDSLNASLLRLYVKLNDETINQESNDLIIYVDKNDKDNVTEERKQYVFNLKHPLNYVNGISDIFKMEIILENNRPIIKTFVERMIKVENGIKSIASNKEIETVDYSAITLFSGKNYIYTNYANANIELVYPKDDDLNKLFLNNFIYSDTKLENPNEFNLDDIYFKDAFTKKGDDLNLEVSDINVNCISSKNNKFSLDNDGNLIVKSISLLEKPNFDFNISEILDKVYPINSIYISTSEVNPETFFGGNWVPFGTGRMLVGVDSSQTEFDTVEKTGGEKNHTLTIAEMPSHNHNYVRQPLWYEELDGTTGALADKSDIANHVLYSTQNSGGNMPHNNMSPYITVYMWKRIV